jgi:hypothetical protein
MLMLVAKLQVLQGSHSLQLSKVDTLLQITAVTRDSTNSIYTNTNTISITNQKVLQIL